MQFVYQSSYISHSGIKGMKWGMRRYQYKDGSLTPAGKIRYKTLINDNKQSESSNMQGSKPTSKSFTSVIRRKTIINDNKQSEGSNTQGSKPTSKSFTSVIRRKTLINDNKQSEGSNTQDSKSTSNNSLSSGWKTAMTNSKKYFSMKIGSISNKNKNLGEKFVSSYIGVKVG